METKKQKIFTENETSTLLGVWSVADKNKFHLGNQLIVLAYT